MAKKYYLNRNIQDNGDMEIHAEDCTYLPDEKNQILIGEFNNANDAIDAARKKIDGCMHCSKEAHTR